MIKSLLRRDRWIRPLFLAVISAFLTTVPVKAADRVFFTYAPVHVSIRIASIENFVNTGEVDANLRFYFNLLNVTQEQQTELRQLLKQRVELNPSQLSRFLNTAIGEDLLQRFGRLITIQGGRNGMYAIRAALISAALDPKGLTALNVLEKLPTNMQVQGESLLEQGRNTRLVVEATQEAIVRMSELSAQEAKTEAVVDFSKLPDPRQPGPYGFQPKVTWQLHDQKRNRHFYVDVYQPKRWRNGQTPVVIVSHGLASRPEDFASIGEHLASYGYLVVLPQHPGSDFQQAQNLLTGLSREVFYNSEFIDRPKDISYLLDELERRNQTEFAGRLNLTSVGAIGHSFGGFGVLAVAGAEIDWQRLKTECTTPNNYPNTSLLLQCRALDLPQENYDFRDKRITAVFAMNPVNSALFGPTGLNKVNIPIVLLSGSYDPATPAVLEQIRTFPWIGSEEKYLILSDGQAHVDFSQLDAGISDLIGSMGDFTLPDPDLLNTYRDALLVPFFEYYQSQNQDYQPFIQSFSAYSQYLSQGQEFKIYLISDKSSQALVSIIQQFRAKHR